MPGGDEYPATARQMPRCGATQAGKKANAPGDRVGPCACAPGADSRRAASGKGEYLGGLSFLSSCFHVLLLPVEAVVLVLVLRDFVTGQAGRLQREYVAGALFGSGLVLLVIGGVGLVGSLLA